MELIIDDGKTVICPECYAYLRFDEPVVEGQRIQCQACRLELVIGKVDGKLVPVIPPGQKGEDESW